MGDRMNDREPQLEDYGVTSEDYDLHRGLDPDLSGRLCLAAASGVAATIFTVVFVVTRDLGAALVWVFFTLIPPIGFLTVGIVLLFATGVINGRRRDRLLASPVAAQIELYEKARAEYWETQDAAVRAQREAERARREAARRRWEEERERLRKQAEYWMSLSGEEFEQEVATLLRRRGYQGIRLTGRSGDGGIDIRARRERRSLIVQCKRYQKPAGPAIVRELYGSLVDSRADGALLFCTGGFTRAAKEFAKGKPIDLLSVWDIVKVAEAVEGNRVEFTHPEPQRASRRRRRGSRW